MNCSVCKGIATAYNSLKQPVCSRHTRTIARAPSCPDCGLSMVVRSGKFNSFWGCQAFPACSGIRKI